MTTFIKFPENYWWGAATSGPQDEGQFGKPHDNVMDYWYKKDKTAFFNQVGPEITSDFFHRYKEDFKLMKECGFNSFRTSVQWSRLIKDLETGEPDQAGIDFYNNIIDEAAKYDIELVLTLHHFDLPVELLHKYGGWKSKHVVDLFVKYAETAFDLFGKKVKYWATHNEPIVVVEGGSLYGFHYPNETGKGKQAVQILYNLNLASAKVIELYRSKNLGGKIGIVLNLTPPYPRSDSEEDKFAAKFFDLFFNDSFLSPAILGEFPPQLVEILKKDNVLWESTDEEAEIIKNNTVDFLGVNYYQPMRAKARETVWPEDVEWMPDKYFEKYDKPGIRMNPYRGWEIYPEGLYDLGMKIKNEYNNIPWYVSENGMGVEGEEQYIKPDGMIHDDYRIEFFKDHLTQLAKAMSEGSNNFGFHSWAVTDCWSWSNAYKNRYGFIAVDLDTQKRTIKKSGYWYKTVIENNGFEVDD